MLKKGLIISLALILSLSIMNVSVQARTEGDYRIGVQSAGPSALSGIYDLSSDTSIQGIIGLGSKSQTLEGRFLYRFRQEIDWNAYGFGSVGLYSNSNSNGFVGGVGIGAEYDLQALDKSLPPMSVNADVGLMVQDDIDSFKNQISIGLHYRF
jgi:hypothetical protein